MNGKQAKKLRRLTNNKKQQQAIKKAFNTLTRIQKKGMYAKTTS